MTAILRTLGKIEEYYEWAVAEGFSSCHQLEQQLLQQVNVEDVKPIILPSSTSITSIKSEADVTKAQTCATTNGPAVIPHNNLLSHMVVGLYSHS